MRKLFAVILSLCLITSPVTSVLGAETAKPAGAGYYANQILSIATASIGSSIITSCPLGTMLASLQLYMAGSLTYIASEIAGAKAQQAFMKSKSEEIDQLAATMKEGGDLQKGIIEVKLQEEKNKLGFVEKRKMWSMAVMAMYGAATGMAMYEKAILAVCAPFGSCVPPMMAGGCTGAGSFGAGLVAKGVAAAYSWGASNAGGGPIASFGNLAMGLATMTTGLGSKIALAYQTPMSRAVTFGASTALMGVVVANLNSEGNKLKSNIQKLEALLAQFKSQTHDVNGTKETAGSGGGEGENSEYKGAKLGVHSSGNYALKALPPGQVSSKVCWGHTKNGTEYSESACTKPVTMTTPKFDASFNIPTIKNATNSAITMANAVSSGDMGKADLEASTLANMAARIKEVNKDLEKQMNDKLVAAGEKPVDMEAEINKEIASLNSQAQSQLGGSGTPNPTIASDGKAKLDEVKAQDASSPTGNNAAPKTAAVEMKGVDLSMMESNTTAMDTDLAQAAKASSLGESLEQYESSASDISKESDASIFKQLSNRYLLNYQRIFEKRKAASP